MDKMSLYGTKSKSIPQKTAIIAIELALLALSYWIMFGAGQSILADWFNWAIESTPSTRRAIIFIFSCIVFLRLGFTMLYLMKRAIPWGETLSVPATFALYYVGFAILVLPSNAPIGAIDIIAIIIFILGSWLNTASELQRDKFKTDPANKGKLYTGGLFAHSMHINFFGDILWVLAYAMITQNIWSGLIVILIALFFALVNVPMLDKYLAPRYGKSFEDYAAHTKRLVPFVW